MNDDYRFVYKDQDSYGNNFLRWRARNNEEKMLYGEDAYSLIEAKEVFDEMYSHKKDVVVADPEWRKGTLWEK